MRVLVVCTACLLGLHSRYYLPDGPPDLLLLLVQLLAAAVAASIELLSLVSVDMLCTLVCRQKAAETSFVQRRALILQVSSLSSQYGS